MKMAFRLGISREEFELYPPAEFFLRIEAFKDQERATWMPFCMLASTIATGIGAFGGSKEVMDQYDFLPKHLRPNDYEKVKRANQKPNLTAEEYKKKVAWFDSF